MEHGGDKAHVNNHDCNAQPEQHHLLSFSLRAAHKPEWDATHLMAVPDNAVPWCRHVQDM